MFAVVGPVLYAGEQPKPVGRCTATEGRPVVRSMYSVMPPLA